MWPRRLSVALNACQRKIIIFCLFLCLCMFSTLFFPTQSTFVDSPFLWVSPFTWLRCFPGRKWSDLTWQRHSSPVYTSQHRTLLSVMWETSLQLISWSSECTDLIALPFPRPISLHTFMDFISKTHIYSWHWIIVSMELYGILRKSPVGNREITFKAFESAK
jgi:hypothetical protein